MQDGTAATSSQINANIALSGGTFNSDASPKNGQVINTISGNFVMTSGTLNLSATPTNGTGAPTLYGERFTVNGNFQVTGGTVNQIATFPSGPMGIQLGGLSNYLLPNNPGPHTDR